MDVPNQSSNLSGPMRSVLFRMEGLNNPSAHMWWFIFTGQECQWSMLAGCCLFRDAVGKEVVSLFKTSLSNKQTFYTDANGREILRRQWVPFMLRDSCLPVSLACLIVWEILVQKRLVFQLWLSFGFCCCCIFSGSVLIIFVWSVQSVIMCTESLHWVCVKCLVGNNLHWIITSGRNWDGGPITALFSRQDLKKTENGKLSFVKLCTKSLLQGKQAASKWFQRCDGQ